MLGDGRLFTGYLQRRTGPVVVFVASLALLLDCELDVEVEIEVAAVRGSPRERPGHPPLVRLNLLERRPRRCPQHHIMVSEVDGKPVEAVRDRRAGRAA